MTLAGNVVVFAEQHTTAAGAWCGHRGRLGTEVSVRQRAAEAAMTEGNYAGCDSGEHVVAVH